MIHMFQKEQPKYFRKFLMKLNHLILIADAVEEIHILTDTDIPDIVNALTGTAWDEEDAVQIKAYFSEITCEI